MADSAASRPLIRFHRLLVIPLLTVLAGAPLARADEATKVAQLLPASTIAFVELPHPDQLVERIMKHPVKKQVDKLPQYQALLRNPGYLQFRLGLGLVEARLGATWQQTVTYLAKHGMYAAFDAKSEGFVVLLRAQDDDKLKRGLTTLLDFAKQNDDFSKNLKEEKYRDQTIYKTNEDAYFAGVGNTFVLTNKKALGKSIVDRLLDGAGPDSLATNTAFVDARKLRPTSPTLWAFVHLDPIRKSGQAKDLFRGKTNNPLLEILVGGIASNLTQLPFATAAITVDEKESSFVVRTPQDAKWIPEYREFYFGPKTAGRSPNLISVKDEIVSLSLYRNFADMWLRAGDLYDENVNDQIAAAESGLATFFSGKDFGEDILGSFRPGARLVVARQSFADKKAVPAMKLPKFALVAEFKDPKTMQPIFRRIFQSLIGFLNVVGAMEGQPQLDQDIVRDGDRTLVTSYYLPDADLKNLKQAPIQFNFSPTVAFIKGHFVVSSTRELADEISKQLATDSKPSGPNSHLTANGTNLKAILYDNREPLIAQNMLEDGNSREEAEASIDLVLEIVGMFTAVEFELDVKDAVMQAELKVIHGAAK